MKSFDMVHVAEIEYNGARMLGLAGWGATVAESPAQATQALQAMGLANARDPQDWPADFRDYPRLPLVEGQPGWETYQSS